MKSLGDIAVPAITNALGGHDEGELRNRADGLNFNIDCAVLDFRARRHADDSANEVQRLVDFGLEQIKRANLLCESPIERQVLPWLVFADYSPFVSGPIPVHNPKKDIRVPDWKLVLIPQCAMLNSRFDFVLLARSPNLSKMIAIECDGADFHDPVKDHGRDQYFSDWRISTARATGAEITHNPRCIVERAARHLVDWQARAVA